MDAREVRLAWRSSVPSTVLGCTTDAPEPIQPNGLLTGGDCFTPQFWLPPGSPHQRGLMYAAELIPTWTRSVVNAVGDTRTTTIHFLVSTWMPYQVVLAAADLVLPVREANAPIFAQIRDYTGKMVQVGTTAVSAAAGGGISAPTTWRVKLVTPTTTPRSLRIGDDVTFTARSGGTDYWLSRSGDDVQFLGVQPGTPPGRVIWRLESTNPTAYPPGTSVIFGQTPFILRNPGEERRLKSKSSGLRNLIGGGADSIWTFSWGCLPGDTCIH